MSDDEFVDSEEESEYDFLEDETSNVSSVETAPATAVSGSVSKKRGRPKQQKPEEVCGAPTLPTSPYRLLVVQLLQRSKRLNASNRHEKHQLMMPCCATTFRYVREMSNTLSKTWLMRKVENASPCGDSHEVEQLRVLYALSIGCLKPFRGGALNALQEVCAAVHPNTALKAPRISAMRSVASGLYAQTCEAFKASQDAWHEAYSGLFTPAHGSKESKELVHLAKTDANMHAIALLATVCAWGTVCNGADLLAHWKQCATTDVGVIHQIKTLQDIVKYKTCKSATFDLSMITPETPCSPTEAALKTRLPSTDQNKPHALHLVRTTYYKVWTSVVSCLLPVFDAADAVDTTLMAKFVIRHAHSVLAAMEGLQAPASRAWLLSAVSTYVCKTQAPELGCLSVDLCNMMAFLPSARAGQTVSPIYGEWLAALNLCTLACAKTPHATQLHDCVTIPKSVFVCRYAALVSGWCHMKQVFKARGLPCTGTLMQTIEHACANQSAKHDVDEDHALMHRTGLHFLNGCRFVSVLSSEDSQARKRVRVRESQSSYVGPTNRVPTPANVRPIQLRSIVNTQMRKKHVYFSQFEQSWTKELQEAWRKSLETLREMSCSNDANYARWNPLNGTFPTNDDEFTFVEQVRLEACLLWMVGDCMRRSRNIHLPAYALLMPLSV